MCAISAMLYPGGQPTCYQQVINFAHSFRNLYILSSGITAILRKIGCHEQNCDCEVTVAIGGSMFEEHHLFKDRVKNMVAQLMGKDCKVELKLQEGEIMFFRCNSILSTDSAELFLSIFQQFPGSGRGAALVAAALKSKNNECGGC